MNFSYKTKGTCSRQIDLEINDNIVTNVVFYGGCDGNLKHKQNHFYLSGSDDRCPLRGVDVCHQRF